MTADTRTGSPDAHVDTPTTRNQPTIPTKPTTDPSAPLVLTLVTASHPPVMTKVFRLVDGALHKTTAASMSRGTARRLSVATLAELAEVLDGLTPAQAVTWGACAREHAAIVPEAATATTPGAIARTREHFQFPAGPGVLMLDHDGTPDEALDVDTLRERLISACPALADAPMLARPSVSSGIQAADGRVLTGPTRHRLYIPVSNASRIPEAGRAICALLWAGGHGWFEVGRAGQALERTLIDASVWQPERLDFCAPPVLHDGLVRPGAGHRIYGNPAARFDLGLLIDAADAAIVRQAQAAKKSARERVRGDCAAQRERWATEHAPELAQRRKIAAEKAREVLIRASEAGVLMGDFELIAHDGTLVAVGDVLDDPDRWHNARFADPLDPDDDRRVAVVNLRSGTRPYLFSHRHGGVRFELRRQSARVQIGRGMRVTTTDAVLEVLRSRGELFDFGDGAVACVAEGRARTVGPDWLTDHLGRVAEFFSVRVKEGPDGEPQRTEIPEDAPSPVARAILAKNGERGFRRLVAVTTAPTLRPDGSVLDVPGHDEASGLLYFCDDPAPPRVPLNPTVDDALDALAELWRPFHRFPLVDDTARGVVLHGLLSAAIRVSLPTTPGIGFDAPAAGTGKTLLGRCIGILAGGFDPPVLPPADTDDEARKRLFAALREGARVLLWDNVRDPLGGAALDSFLTAPTFKDRVLGSSETAELPNRALFIATGNNLRLTGDTCRRILVARLDAESERPYARDFEFDPAQMLMVRRTRYVVAALTIIRAYIAAGRPKAAQGRSASFELWDDLVRQPLVWLAAQVTRCGRTDVPTFTDPLKATERAFEHDPETTKHAALLHAWHAAFDGTRTTVAAALTRADTDDALREALDEIGGQGSKINPRIVGRWIERHVGRRIKGLRFERGSMARGLTTWQVCVERPKHGGAAPSSDAAPAAGGGLGGDGGSVSGHRTVDVPEADDAEVIE